MSKRRKRHSPEQIVKKLRDAEAMLNTGRDLAAVLQTLEVSEATKLPPRYDRNFLSKVMNSSRLSESLIHTHRILTAPLPNAS